MENAFGVGDACPFQSTYYVAVSQTSDPRGTWNVYAFEMTMGQPFAADYTQLGMNSQAVYLSANNLLNKGKPAGDKPRRHASC